MFQNQLQNHLENYQGLRLSSMQATIADAGRRQTGGVVTGGRLANQKP